MPDLEVLRPKFAELCGLKPGHERTGPDPGDFAQIYIAVPPERSFFQYEWRPDEDVAQAIRCLEGVRPKWEIHIAIQPALYVVRMHKYHYSACNASADALTLPAAICLAIAAALGWA